MNRIANSLTALAVVAVLMIPLSAREQIPERRGSARAIAPWQEKNPYASLFTTPDKQQRDLQKKARRQSRPCPDAWSRRPREWSAA